MIDRRRHKRFTVDIMEINSKMILAEYVKILDLSAGGVSLEADRRLNIGNEYSLKIEYRGRDLMVKGVVVWSRMGQALDAPGDSLKPVYIAGMQFTDVSNEKIHEVVNFIEVHKEDVVTKVDETQHCGFRLHVRVKIENPGNAVLNFSRSYKVRNLSLSGMRIESADAIEVESILPMEMTLSDDKSVKFLGRVASSLFTEDENSGHYDMGIEFLRMPDTDRETLRECILLLDYIDSDSSSTQLTCNIGDCNEP